MQTLLAFLLVLGVLITAHELGHYWVARWCGVKVLRFSVGFGRPILRFQRSPQTTEWVLAIFPLGGYVKMLDEREGAVNEADKPFSFNAQPLWQRSLIVAAGPMANFLAAIALFWVVFVSGTDELRPLVAAPKEGTPAAVAGLQNGDEIRRLDGQPVVTWQDVRWILLKGSGARSVPLEWQKPTGEIQFGVLEISAPLAAEMQGADGEISNPLGALGLSAYRPLVPAVIDKVMPGGPAEGAGFQSGDRVVAIDDQPIQAWQELVERVRQSEGRPLAMRVHRGDGVHDLMVTPESADQPSGVTFRVGLQARIDQEANEALFVTVRYGAVDSIERALVETWEKSVFTLKAFGRMITGEMSWRNLSGPVAIADYAGQSAKLGLAYYLQFMALVSISLGVLNLLPVPLLDGGHLMYYAVEAITRRPLSERLQEIGQQIGLALLIGLMAFAFYNDIQRLISG